MAVPGMRKPCVKTVAEALTLFLPPSHCLFEARAGSLAQDGPRWPAPASLRQTWPASAPFSRTHQKAAYSLLPATNKCTRHMFSGSLEGREHKITP